MEQKLSTYKCKLDSSDFAKVSLADDNIDVYELKFKTHTENLFYDLTPTLRKFENNFLSTISNLIIESFGRAIGQMNHANRVKNKKNDLKGAQAELETARFFIKVLRKEKAISRSFFKHLDICITVISKMIGSYLVKL